jgi:hypothetical protein
MVGSGYAFHMIDYNVPFYGNTPDGTHCFQAALRMVLKYFSPERDFTWEELERITAKPEGKWTWPIAAALWLEDNGFEVKFIETFDYDDFSRRGAEYLLDTYGKEVTDAQVAKSDIEQEMRLAKELAGKVSEEKRIATADDIRALLGEGFLIIANINSRVLRGKEGYSGHSVVVKGFNEDGFVIHEPGLPPIENMPVDLAFFEKAWAYPSEEAKNILAVRPKK